MAHVQPRNVDHTFAGGLICSCGRIDQVRLSEVATIMRVGLASGDQNMFGVWTIDINMIYTVCVYMLYISISYQNQGAKLDT